MDVGTLLLVLLLLACPLMMVFMHRGGHGAHGGPELDGHAGDEASRAPSLHELRRQRKEIDSEIARLEDSTVEASPSTPTAA